MSTSSGRARKGAAFLGAGAVARALGTAAARRGIPVIGFAATSLASARSAARAAGGGARAFRSAAELARGARLVIVAVPDRAIGDAARALAPALQRGAVVAHVSGSRGSEALAACRARGARVASFHPIQTFPDRRRGADRVAGAFVAIEGDREAVAALRRFARRLGLRPLSVGPGRRGLYHASAVLASNAVVALFDLAVERFARATGLPRRTAERALRPLLAGTVENLGSIGLPGALSGPIARGDETTLAANLAALAGDREGLGLYRALGRRAVDVARRKGTISPVAARRILRRLASR